MSNIHMLQRQIHLPGAILLGLGSILGTGVFVSIGLAAGATGSSVVLAIVVAAIVAICNGLSSAELAANHAVSGGTYEYGYRWLSPSFGFMAGWLFLCAKSASAATAALGLAGYLLSPDLPNHRLACSALAVIFVAAITLLVLTGIRRSNHVNAVIVGITIVALMSLILSGFSGVFQNSHRNWQPIFSSNDSSTAFVGFLKACALMFVAYTGYGRLATLGEEIIAPRRNIPLAIIITLIASMMLYIGVAIVSIATVGPAQLADSATSTAAPLQTVADHLNSRWLAIILTIGAITAMAGVLLNLILGLSRVVLAMARRGDLPRCLSSLSREQKNPLSAVIAVGAIVGVIAAAGNIKLAWSFSAFTVLIYYSITNLAALRLDRQNRLVHPIIPSLGLIACLFLAAFVDIQAWAFGLIMILLGFVIRYVLIFYHKSTSQAKDS